MLRNLGENADYPCRSRRSNNVPAEDADDEGTDRGSFPIEVSHRTPHGKLMRSTLTATALVLLLLRVIAVAQNQPLAFEVATIKPSPPPAGRLISVALCRGTDTKLPVYPAESINPVPAQGRCLLRRATLKEVIALAYPSTVSTLSANDRVTGGPGWVSTDNFDIEGKAENSASVNDQELHSMLRQLLAERFKLQFHTVPKEVKGYALTVARNGHKLTPGAGEMKNLFSGERQMSAKNASTAELARFLSTLLRAPVVDRTGLSGGYAFRFSQPAENDPSPASIFTVLQEELGLRLESTTLPLDVIVIDHAEKPDAN